MRVQLLPGLKTHIDNEFQIFSYLGRDLPGALIATPVQPDDVPKNILSGYEKSEIVKLDAADAENRFSLAGIQMKFSMKEKDGRYHIARTGDLGNWIIKTPSTKHKNVPLNEYTAMSLAALTGVDIPEIRIIELNKLDNLPQINLPDEPYAFAIKRFDRDGSKRIHMEDLSNDHQAADRFNNTDERTKKLGYGNSDSGEPSCTKDFRKQEFLEPFRKKDGEADCQSDQYDGAVIVGPH